jgi:predicted MFS family arabinose efflux permease
MNKKVLTYISVSYTFLVLGGFCVYAYFVQEGGSIDTQKHFNELLIFGILGVIGLLLASIDAAGDRDKNKKVNSKTIYFGIVIAIFFLIWRISIGLF